MNKKLRTHSAKSEKNAVILKQIENTTTNFHAVTFQSEFRHYCVGRGGIKPGADPLNMTTEKLNSMDIFQFTENNFFLFEMVPVP